MPNINFRDSQSFILGSGRFPAAPNHTLNFTAQRDVMLGRCNILTSGVQPGSGMINTFTIQGQSIMTSNVGASIRGTFPQLADDGANYIGVPLIANGQVQIQTGNYLDGNEACSSGIFCDPWDTSILGPVPPPDAIGASGLNYLFGLGQTPVAAGGAPVNIQATALRDVQLGMLFLDAYDAVAHAYVDSAEITITSIMINRTEQLVSTQGVPLSMLWT